MFRKLFSESKGSKICDICSARCDNVVDTGRYDIPLAHCEQCVQKMVHELMECNRVLKNSCNQRSMTLTYNHTNNEWEVHTFEDGKNVRVLSTSSKESAERYLDYIEGTR